MENGDRLGKTFTNEFSLSVWQCLLDTASGLCVRESDKLKSYLVRTLGNLINYVTLIDVELIRGELPLESVCRSVTAAVDALCSCKNVKMLKVKWNLSHAIGVAMRRFGAFPLQLDNPAWLQAFYDTLLELFTMSNNFKVRINACVALMNINLSRNDKQAQAVNASLAASVYLKFWLSMLDTFTKINNENINLLDVTNELQHKTMLTHQARNFVIIALDNRVNMFKNPHRKLSFVVV